MAKLTLRTGASGGWPAAAQPTAGPAAATPSASGLRSKFQRRAGEVLQQTYDQREERSKGGSSGKSLFNQEMLKALGVTEFKPAWGGNFLEILPPSYDTNTPYFLEVPVHYRCGINKDTFLCTLRFNNQSCYRCETQRNLFRQNSAMTKEIKALYPNDRCIYLLWDRTPALGNHEDETHDLKIWAAPKSKVHAAIQSIVRDKKTQRVRDISDVSAGGEGRTVYFDATKTDVAEDKAKGQNKATYPTYSGFSLEDRDGDIPDIILEKLAAIIQVAEEAGVAHPLEIFLHVPDPGEMRFSMDSSIDPEAEGNNTPATGGGGTHPTATKGHPGVAAPTPGGPVNEDQVATELAALQDELMAMNALKFKLWCKANVDGVDSSVERGPLVDQIIEAMYEQRLAGGGTVGEEDIPF